MTKPFNYHFSAILSCILFLGSANYSNAQQMISGGIGIGSVRGDMISDFFSPTGFGPSIQASYLRSIGSGKVWVGGTISFLYNQQSRDFSASAQEMQLRMLHTFVGVTAKAYLTGGKTDKRSKRQFMPFVVLSAGGELYSTTLTQGGPVNGYTLTEGFAFSPGVDGGLGFEWSMSKYLSFNTSASMRVGFSDVWDGVQGTGSDSDAIINLNLGLTYVIPGKEIF